MAKELPPYKSVSVSKLKPYKRNARTHSPAQVDQIAASIREFGFTNPVLIDGSGNIIAGHGRVMAAKQLGLAEVPCLEVGWLTEDQKRAYILADNQLALNAGWDWDTVRLELADLELAGFDVDLIGFTDEITGVFDVEEVHPANLPSGDRAPFRQITFTVHDEQFEEIEAALTKAKSEGGGVSAMNENTNGNAVAFICGRFNNGQC